MRTQTIIILIMDNLFLVQNDDFTALCEILKLEPQQLIDKIENGFKDNDLELCENEDAGVLFSEILKNYNYNVSVVALKFLGRSDNAINKIFGNLFFKHVNDECPECGHELEHEEDGMGKHTWTDTKCSNGCCDYATSNEPDWDCMPGGHDYY